MSGTAFPSKVTQVDTVARFPLGYEATLPATKSGAGGVNDDTGEEVWVYVKASVALAAGDVCSYAAAATTKTVRLVPANTNVCTIVGVAQHVIAINSFGFIQKRGLASVTADAGGVTINVGLMVGDAPGTADAAGAVTTASFGVATASAASAAAVCWIDCRA
jgi:hypothetical protein